MTDLTSPRSKLSPVIDAISILMAWRTTGNFQARVHHQLGAEPSSEYQLEARPRQSSYRLVSKETGLVDSFDAVSRSLISAGERVEYRDNMLVFEPLPVRLAFPLSLGIWGRSFDDYRIVDGASAGDDIILSLSNTRDPQIAGLLTVSRAQRKAVRLDTPTQKIVYESIEPL